MTENYILPNKAAGESEPSQSIRPEPVTTSGPDTDSTRTIDRRQDETGGEGDVFVVRRGWKKKNIPENFTFF